jgi:NAD(P)-dependent dehydrogenase (short-subunit alcohol dehydrogenase family)
MKLTIFAATGGIGRQLLEQALAAGHDVTAVVRNPKNLPGEAGRFRIVTADLAAAGPSHAPTSPTTCSGPSNNRRRSSKSSASPTRSKCQAHSPWW